jgi:hypothetical protein
MMIVGDTCKRLSSKTGKRLSSQECIKMHSLAVCRKRANIFIDENIV